MPEFFTTTSTDRSIAAMLFMSSMQQYFTYEFYLLCGISSITLLGEVTDWIKMLGKLTKLESFGEEPKCFAQVLRLILYHLILSFEQPYSSKVKGFWNTIMAKGKGSGSSLLSGWITAFCYWDVDGKTTSRQRKDVLDRVSYPVVATSSIPVGSASVPVTITDGSDEWRCVILAGSIGIQTRVMDSYEWEMRFGESERSEKADYIAINPVSGWLIYGGQEESLKSSGDN
jgi:hypothetical protein